MKTIPVFALAALLGAAPVPPLYAADGEREVLYWVAPMDPNYRREEPGKSPMGMDLTPVYADEVGSGEEEGLPGVEVSPAMSNSLGVRVRPAKVTELSRRVETVGYVGYDEQRISHVHLRTEGWIEDLKVRILDQPVTKGQLLFRFYSPSLINAQEEFLQALTVGDRRLKAASRERLIALGVPHAVAAQLERTRKVQTLIPFYAGQEGVVSELNIREGMYVQPATEVMALADTSSVWVMVDVFERQAGWIAAGQTAEVRVPYLPGEKWQGDVQYVYSSLDPKTRTLKVRLRFDNSDGRLKPNMYTKATILAEPRRALSIPREALIRTGSGSRVVLARGEGRFQPVEVEAGIESGDRVEIRKGLEAGDEVVVSAQFLIDSESSLKASFLRMSDAEPADIDPHPDMEHESAPEAAEPMAVVQSRGTLHRIDSAAGKVNMTHEPIPDLGWPAMTMDFEVDPKVSLELFGVDDVVTFELHQVGQFEYHIVAMESVGAERQAPVFSAAGVLNEIAADGRTVNISHKPIPAIGWPPMTMDLALADGVDVKGIAPGASVTFDLRQLDAVTFEISAISPNREDQDD